MTVAFAVVAFASCSDDLVNSSNVKGKPGTMYASLEEATITRVAMIEGTGTAVWSLGDVVSVYSPNMMVYNTYTLEAGEGTKTGTFVPKQNALENEENLYAITESNNIWGVSAASEDGTKIKLTADIPYAFEQDAVVAAGKNNYKFPVPYWGKVNSFTDGQMNVGFKALTSFIMVNLKDLPEGTQALVLTTSPYTVGAKTYNQQGAGEGLSGRYSAILEDGASLTPDEGFKCVDTLRVNFAEPVEAMGDKIAYIPVVSQTYQSLELFAVVKDNIMPYTYDKVVKIKTYTDYEFERGGIEGIRQAAEVFVATATPSELSALIAEQLDGTHVTNYHVGNLLNTADDNKIWVVANAADGYNTSAIISIDGFNGAAPLYIVERDAKFHNVTTGGSDVWNQEFDSWTGTDVLEKIGGAANLDTKHNYFSQPKARTISLNLTAAAVAKGPVYIITPSSNVVINSDAIQTQTFSALTANTNNVSGTANYKDGDQDVQKISNLKEAALILTGVFTEFDVLRRSYGAVYAYGETTEIGTLKNLEEAAGDIRLTDALVGTIQYTRLNTEAAEGTVNYIYTTGSAAIQQLLDPSNNAHIKAYWTGKMLTPAAISGTTSLNKRYEGTQVLDEYNSIASGAIYTAAQLQALGASATTYEYAISPKTRSIHLGGKAYPWIGAEVAKQTTAASGTNYPVYAPASSLLTANGIEQAFKLDGRGVKLFNMVLDINNPYLELDGCCGDKVKVLVSEDLGLIRRIHTKSTVDIWNVQLNDVLLNTDININNIGSLVGEIEAQGNVTIEGDPDTNTTTNITNTRIDAVGDNIGGAVGLLQTQAIAKIKQVNVESLNKDGKNYGGHFITTGDNVGGLVGNLTGVVTAGTKAAPTEYTYPTQVEINKDFVALLTEITANEGANVGGFVGNLMYESTDDNHISGIVRIPTIQATINEKQEAKNPNDNYTGRNVGGLVGRLQDFTTDKKVTWVDGEVKAATILAEKVNAGGFFGYTNITSTPDKTSLNIGGEDALNSLNNKVNVNVTDKIEATQGWAGGLIGQQDKGMTKILDVIAPVTVTVGSLNGAYCVGGLVGENLDELAVLANTTVNKVPYGITITVSNWVNTQDYQWFVNHSKQGYCGSFAHILGQQSQPTTIDESLLTVVATNANENNTWEKYTSGGTHKVIKPAIKDALLFWVANDPQDTQGEFGLKFWGDERGYIGQAKGTSTIFIKNGVVQGDYVMNISKEY